MSLKALSDYTVYSKYAKYLPEKQRRETWDEMVDRVFSMHAIRYAEALKNEEFKKEFEFAKLQMRKKRVLGAQRILQFGGDSIFKHNAKVYNCSFTYMDRPEVFNEIMYLLLCGCGVGFSVQNKHVQKLPKIKNRGGKEYIFTPEDSIEGWSDCVKVLMDSFFDNNQKMSGCPVKFNFSNIRPEGSLIAGQFKAPGPKGLEKALEKAAKVIGDRLANGENRLHPIDVYDIVMHCSNAVLSGGVRRSATICLFSKEDEEMMNAKIGNWFEKNPQRARSNNSVLLVRDKVIKEEFDKIIESTKHCGEPGFVFAEDEDCGFNPCVTGDTLVTTDKGDITIKELAESNNKYKALSYNIDTNQVEFKNIQYGIKTKENANIIKIELENGKVLKCTPDHQIFTKNRGYIPAAQLNENDLLVSNENIEEYKEIKENTVVPYINQKQWVNKIIASN